jgi:purine-cytosine permease-like protein
VQAGSAITSVFPELPFAPAAFVLSVLVLAWALLLGSPAVRLNNIVVILLSILCAVLFAESAGRADGTILGAGLPGDAIGMALAIELSIAMPVSWLPLIGDYAVSAGDRTCAAGMPFAGYFAGSTLMYLFGLFIALSAGGDIFAFVAESRFRYLACGVILFSTLTTAFLYLYSAAESSGRIVGAKSKRAPILVTGLFAAAVSVFFPVELYSSFLEQFLTSIGMVFVPVYTVIFLEFFMAGPVSEQRLHVGKLLMAIVGMAAYNLFNRYEIGIPTVMTILLVAVIYMPYSMATRKKAPI